MHNFRSPTFFLTAVLGSVALALGIYMQSSEDFTMASAFAESGGPPGQQRHGILGRAAPELNLSNWIDGRGKPTGNVELASLRGKVVYLYFFQDWCPGCHSHGFPTLKTLAETFGNDDRVALLAVQTAFEGKHTNTADKLRKNQIDYNLAIPMAHDSGEGNRRGLPQTMIDYRSGGTPWTVIIDPGGKVVYNQFHIDVHQAIDLIRSLRRVEQMGQQG